MLDVDDASDEEDADDFEDEADESDPDVAALEELDAPPPRRAGAPPARTANPALRQVNAKGKPHDHARARAPKESWWTNPQANWEVEQERMRVSSKRMTVPGETNIIGGVF